MPSLGFRTDQRTSGLRNIGTTMSSSEIDIEAIVRSVLRQMQTPGAAVAVAPREQVHESGAGSIRQLPGRVITANLLAEQVKPGDRIQLEQRAIITPSARDYLKTHQISVAESVAGVIARPKSVESSRWLGLLVETSPALQAALQSVLGSSQAKGMLQRSSSTEEAAATAISEINRGTAQGILILTNRPAVAACLANRHERVRALAVRHRLDLPGVEELNPNVVCLTNQGLGFSDYLPMLRRILTNTL